VPAREARLRLGPHAPDDLDALRELIDALADVRERDLARVLERFPPLPDRLDNNGKTLSGGELACRRSS
jgi:hypothetical protein